MRNVSAVAFGFALVLLSSGIFAADVKPTLDSSAPCPTPEYPRTSLANEEQGTVVLGILVAPDGKVADSKIEKSSGHRALDKATVSTFAKCKYKPGTKDGKLDQVWVNQAFEWKLD